MLPPEHPQKAATLDTLAKLSLVQDKAEQAEALFQRALVIRERHFGLTHPDIARSLMDLAKLYEQRGAYERADPLWQRAYIIFEQCLGQAHPETTKTWNDYQCFIEKRKNATAMLTEEQQERAAPLQESLRQNRLYLNAPSEEAPATSEQEAGSLIDFFVACCELHPRAWCRASEIWHAYEHWAKEQQERFPLSRRAFTAQLKTHGCRADRTATTRIWRGIALARKYV